MIPYNNKHLAWNIKIRINGLKSYTYFLRSEVSLPASLHEAKYEENVHCMAMP